jgi:hypothetical protein
MIKGQRQKMLTNAKMPVFLYFQYTKKENAWTDKKLDI